MRVQYAEGEPQLYTLPLAYATGADAQHLATTVPHAVIAQVQRAGAAPAGYLYDPMWSARFAQGLLTTVAGRRRVPGQYGVLEALATPVLRTARAAPRSQLTPSVLQAAHNNTSVLYGTHVMLKLFRCIDEGLNPDLELGRFLTEHGFAHTPPVAGALTYTPHRGESMSVAIVQRYVPNQGELRDVLQTALHAYFTRVRGRRAPATPPLCAQTVLAYGGDAPSPAVQAVLGEVRTLAQVLGQRTAEMHLTLASDPTAPAFAPVPFTAFYQRALYQAERSRVGRVLAALHKQLPRLPAEAQAQASRLLTLREPLVQRFQQIAHQPIRAQRLRCHGDFHLGQVLVTGADLMLVDFEGQPQQRVSERQLKRSPLVDVASMLWSLQSAPAMALRTAQRGCRRRLASGPAPGRVGAPVGLVEQYGLCARLSRHGSGRHVSAGDPRSARHGARPLLARQCGDGPPHDPRHPAAVGRGPDRRAAPPRGGPAGAARAPGEAWSGWAPQGQGELPRRSTGSLSTTGMHRPCVGRLRRRRRHGHRHTAGGQRGPLGRMDPTRTASSPPVGSPHVPAEISRRPGVSQPKLCHHFLYSGGAFVRLYPVNPRSTRNRAAKTKRRPHVRYKFGLDIWGLASVTDSRLKSPRM